ncbi:MAG: YggS family pyridoxal phosphate-dependent enzyme [Flavobacteriales bacterium]
MIDHPEGQVTMEARELAARYAAVKATIPAGVKLIAVSKTRSVEEIRALYDLGHRAFGENYPQEIREKQPLLPADIEWHFIGHLQTNKVKYVAPFIHLVHAVDSSRLLDELQKRATAASRSIDVLLQVHIAREETKHGWSAPELRMFLETTDHSERWPHLRLCGLMGMATNTADPGVVREEFDGLAGLFHELRKSGQVPVCFKELSMGMTSDARIAIEAGSTMVRIGTAIFGDRE